MPCSRRRVTQEQDLKKKTECMYMYIPRIQSAHSRMACPLPALTLATNQYTSTAFNQIIVDEGTKHHIQPLTNALTRTARQQAHFGDRVYPPTPKTHGLYLEANTHLSSHVRRRRRVHQLRSGSCRRRHREHPLLVRARRRSGGNPNHEPT